MHVAIIGTGYAGLVTGACFADMGHVVACVDTNTRKIQALKRGVLPFHERGLDEMIVRNRRTKHLSFSSNIGDAIRNAAVIFCAVGTPEQKNGRADISQVLAVAETVGRLLDHHAVFVVKSTVPVGTTDRCAKIIASLLLKRKSPVTCDVVSNPEFLREGTAIKDMLNPDRIIVGSSSEDSRKVMEQLYRPLTRLGFPMVCTTTRSAELIKYASNAFLATKISFMNGLTGLCEQTGADIRSVAHGMGFDRRIGSSYLHAGIGYGGSCLPKDVRALIAMGKDHGTPLHLVEAVHRTNEQQRSVAVQKLRTHLPRLRGKTIAVWGISFKPRTDDIRGSVALDVIRLLRTQGARVRAYDPEAMQPARAVLKNTVTFAKNPYDAVRGCDALLVLTEWPEFTSIDLGKVKRLMRGTVIIDGKNIYDHVALRRTGFTVEGIGIPSPS